MAVRRALSLTMLPSRSCFTAYTHFVFKILAFRGRLFRSTRVKVPSSCKFPSSSFSATMYSSRKGSFNISFRVRGAGASGSFEARRISSPRFCSGLRDSLGKPPPTSPPSPPRLGRLVRVEMLTSSFSSSCRVGRKSLVTVARFSGFDPFTVKIRLVTLIREGSVRISSSLTFFHVTFLVVFRSPPLPPSCSHA